MANFELICGPMFSGKTEELIRKIKRFEYGGKKVVVFKPKIDDRYILSDVVSHNGTRITSVPVSSAADIITYVRSNEGIDVIAIDEIQFFDKYIIQMIQVLIKKGYKIIATGLDKNFRKEPFGPMPELLAIADAVTKITALCSVCGKEAAYTQRVVKGKPAKYDSKEILVGESDKYEARCLEHHELPGEPDRNIF